MRTQTTDTQIIQLLTERDESALTIIEREYGRLYRKISLDILSNQQDAEECCNDALMRVWNSIPPIHPDSLRAYLVTIVRHLSIDRYKAGKAKCRDDSRMAEANRFRKRSTRSVPTDASRLSAKMSSVPTCRISR